MLYAASVLSRFPAQVMTARRQLASLELDAYPPAQAKATITVTAVSCQVLNTSTLLALFPGVCPPSPPSPQVMSTLKSLASQGHTVVCSIHQPRSSIFAMFDDLLLLCEGRPVYWGPADQVRACRGGRRRVRWHYRGDRFGLLHENAA